MSSRMSRAIALLPWVAFSAVLLVLALCDSGVNSILDERHYVQGGLGAAAHRFLRTGFSSGPAYPLASGALFSGIYLGGAATGTFASPPDFMAWHLVHPELLFLAGRLLTAAGALAGLALLARAMVPRIGTGWASLLCLGFAFTAPSLQRLAFATPHGWLVGCSAALLAALVTASEGRSTKAWAAAGAVASLAACTMTIGVGLFVLPLWVAILLPAESDGLGRIDRLKRVALGAAAGLAAFGFPILLHPGDYWAQNVRYQLHRQVLSDAAGDGNLLLLWAVQGPTLWILGLGGAWASRPGRERTLATGALLAALGFLLVPALLTRSRQASYSLAALPCLAYAASSLVPRARALRGPLRIPLCAALLALPAWHASAYVLHRTMAEDPKAAAAARMVREIPAGSVVLVDSWWGPRIAHRDVILEPYRKHVPGWMKDPAFARRLEAGLPPEHNRWDVVVYPEGVEAPLGDFISRRGIGYAAIGAGMMLRPPHRDSWDRLRREGRLEELDASPGGEIRLLRIRP